MKKVNPAAAYHILKTETRNGKIFSVKFTKMDGTERDMVCRRGVKKGVKGTGLKYNRELKGLLGVHEMNGGFKNISLSTVKEFKVNGEHYVVDYSRLEEQVRKANHIDLSPLKDLIRGELSKRGLEHSNILIVTH